GGVRHVDVLRTVPIDERSANVVADVRVLRAGALCDGCHVSLLRNRSMYRSLTIAAMRFESKRDWWLIAILRGAPFIVFAVIVMGWDARHRGMAGPIVGL